METMATVRAGRLDYKDALSALFLWPGGAKTISMSTMALQSCVYFQAN